MSSVSDDRYLWSRVLLAALSVVFLGVAGLLALGSPGIDPEDRSPTTLIAVLAVLALAGMTLAAFGGPAARIACGGYGLLVTAGALLIAEPKFVILGGLAVVVAVRPRRQRSAPGPESATAMSDSR
jgi:hypothetical protein